MKSVLQIVAVALMILSTAGLATAADQGKNNPKGKVVEVAVTKKGFEPSSIGVAPGTPLTLKITRRTDATCAKKVTVAGMDVKKDLPMNEPVTVELGALEKGDVKFGCGMNRMVGGMIFVK